MTCRQGGCRVDLRAIIADPNERKTLMIGLMMAVHDRNGTPITLEQAEELYSLQRAANKTLSFSERYGVQIDMKTFLERERSEP